MTYGCGCINEIDADSGVMHCVKKCDEHITWSLTHTNDRLEYYASMGCLSNGIPQNQRYMVELKEAFGELNEFFAIDDSRVSNSILEIGCGLGMYVPLFLRRGWYYRAVESSKLAAYWTENTFDVIVYNESFEEWLHHSAGIARFNAMFGAHVFEHMQNAPDLLMEAYYALQNSGKLFLIVPDDTDQTNPDHFYFFTQETLRALLEKIGFVNIRMTMRKIVDYENFIYCVAEKP